MIQIGFFYSKGSQTKPIRFFPGSGGPSKSAVAESSKREDAPKAPKRSNAFKGQSMEQLPASNPKAEVGTPACTAAKAKARIRKAKSGDVGEDEIEKPQAAKKDNKERNTEAKSTKAKKDNKDTEQEKKAKAGKDNPAEPAAAKTTKKPKAMEPEVKPAPKKKAVKPDDSHEIPGDVHDEATIAAQAINRKDTQDLVDKQKVRKAYKARKQRFYNSFKSFVLSQPLFF